MEKKKLVVALGTGMAVSLSASVLASQGSSSPFQTTTMTTAYNGQSGQLSLAAQDGGSIAGSAKQAQGKCGKGKCGKGNCGGSKVQDGKKANGGCGDKKANGSCAAMKSGGASDAKDGDAGATDGGH